MGANQGTFKTDYIVVCSSSTLTQMLVVFKRQMMA